MKKQQAVAEAHTELAVVLLLTGAHGLKQRDNLAPLDVVGAAAVVKDLVESGAVMAGEVIGHAVMLLSCE